MGQFTDTTWHEIVKGVGTAFGLSCSEEQDLEIKKVPKLIAGLPYLADCDDRDRIAFAHMAIYLLEIKNATLGGDIVGACRSSDFPDVFKRLEMIGNFSGGNRSIIDRGMRVLAWFMIKGYKRTAAADKNNKIYNPVNDPKFGSAYCDKLLAVLKADIDAVECNPMDAILDIHNGPPTGNDVFWMF